MRSLTLVAALLLAAGCDSDTIEHGSLDGGSADGVGVDAGPDLGAPDSATADGAGATLSIYIRGDTTSKTFGDGLAGQTPKVYVMGLGRFDIMTSASDPAPVTVFDHGNAPVEVDLLSETLGGQGHIADLPAGSYSHGRVLLTMSRFTVDATVHAVAAFPGEIEVVAALSDTTISGKPWTQGQASFSFKSSGGQPVTIPATLPPLPTTGGGTIVQQGGETWLVFPFPKPIDISPSSTSRRATIVYQVFESFRWQDQTKAGFQDDVFDVDALGLSFEAVKNYGATGYSVELD